MYDPFMFLAYITAHTNKIALGTSSIVTTLRHPLHTAKSAATLDRMSQQRFLFGTATGERPIEFPAFKVEYDDRVELYQESIAVMRRSEEHTSELQSRVQLVCLLLLETKI